MLAAASERFSSGSLRLVALLLPSGTLLAAVAAGCCTVPQPSPALAALLGVVLCAIAAAHYAWSRRHPPPAGSRYARLQPSDRVAILSLCAAASAAFCAARVLLHPFLARLPVDRDAAFAGGQSVLLALLSVALLLLARATTSRAMLSTAVLAGVVTGFKVFASDFLTLRGLPLVTSVFAFGATAAIGSFVLGRWPRTRPATDDPATGAP